MKDIDEPEGLKSQPLHNLQTFFINFLDPSGDRRSNGFAIKIKIAAALFDPTGVS
jgi:hypothetical protein